MSSSAFIILSCLVATMLAFASSHPMENQYLDANYYEEPYQVYYGEIMDQQVSYQYLLCISLPLIRFQRKFVGF